MADATSGNCSISVYPISAGNPSFSFSGDKALLVKYETSSEAYYECSGIYHYNNSSDGVNGNLYIDFPSEEPVDGMECVLTVTDPDNSSAKKYYSATVTGNRLQFSGVDIPAQSAACINGTFHKSK